jgi:Fe-S-cluster-containing dehydrogenase component
MDRRNFLKLLGVTSSTALVTSCGVDKANEKIIPYVVSPELDVFPGRPYYMNTSCSECPANCGMTVTIKEKVYDGQRELFPTKLEGLKGHPINDGALCMRGQAGLFRLYHPDRIKRPMMKDQSGNLRVATWKEAFEIISEKLKMANTTNKSNFYCSSKNSGTFAELLDEFCRENKIERIPEIEWFSYGNIKAANELVFNIRDIPQYKLDKTDFLLTFGADIFETFLNPVFFTKQYAQAKKASRLKWYHFEPHISLTGMQSNQRFQIKPNSESVILAFLIHTIFEKKLQRRSLSVKMFQLIPKLAVNEVTNLTGISEDQLNNVVLALSQAKNPLVISGGVSTGNKFGLQTAVLTAILQYILGSIGVCIDFTDTYNYTRVGTATDLDHFLKQLNQESLGVVFVSKLDFTSQIPKFEAFLSGLKRAELSIGMAEVLNETVQNCDVILPLSHTLESWGDTKPQTGIRNFYQPVIDTQYDSLTEGEIILRLSAHIGNSSSNLTFKDHLFNRWEVLYGGEESTELFKSAFKLETSSPLKVALNQNKLLGYLTKITSKPEVKGPVLILAPSIRNYDGRSKNLILLEEIPDPLTTISYGSWILISPETASEFDLDNFDEINLNIGDFSIDLQVKIQILLGKGVFVVQQNLIPPREDPLSIQIEEFYWVLEGIEIKKTGRKKTFPVLAGSVEEEHRGILPPEGEEAHSYSSEAEHKSLYPPHKHETYRWGLTIDLDSCIGCGACSAACYVENNIPIVGEEEHLKGREMSWIRIEPFFSQETGRAEFVPVMCQHCDNAPCEPVCPVYAAYHNPEGLNVQVYNRCVGTRYCANNCPYKVRRFNWFDHHLPEPLDKMYNPDLSVRGRGIMEKCTFCIQRIRSAKDTAKDQNRNIRDGEVITACAQTCPTNAITFGNLLDKTSTVYNLAEQEGSYRILEELGTQPAIHYLKKKNTDKD